MPSDEEEEETDRGDAALGNPRVPTRCGAGALPHGSATRPCTQVLAESQEGPRVGEPGWTPPPTSRLSTRAADIPNVSKTWGSLCKTRETPRQMRASRVLDDGWSVLTSYNHSVVTRQLRGTREKEAARPARGIEVRRWGRVVTQAWKSKPLVTMSPETWRAGQQE